MGMRETVRWPAIDEPYNTALAEAVAFIRDCFEPIGLLAAGSVIRGAAQRRSDLDLLVIARKPEHRQLGRFFNGVAVEIFVNSPERMERHLEAEPQGGWLVNTHMLALGYVMYEADPLVGQLRARAAAVLSGQAELSDAALSRLRYHVAAALEDGLDVADDDAEQAAALFARAVEGAIQYRFWTAHQWQPRHKDTLRALEAVDENLARCTRAFYRATAVGERGRLAREIVRLSTGVTGFFEWDSGEAKQAR
jgi:hypothetical protein